MNSSEKKGPRLKGARGVYKRGGTWCAVVELPKDATGKRTREWLTGYATRKDAETARDRRRGELSNGAAAIRDHVTVAELFERWMTSKVTLAETTRVNDQSRIDLHILPHLGTMLARKVEPLHIQTLYTTLQTTGCKKGKRSGAGLGETTTRKVHVLLKGAFSWGVRMGLVANTPFERIDKKDTPKDRSAGTKGAYSEDELDRVLAAIDGTPVAICALLAVYAGLRRGEVAALRWECVNFERRELYVRAATAQIRGKLIAKEPKGKRARTIPLADELVSALQSRHLQYRKMRLQWRERFHDDGYVCVDDLGVPFTPEEITRYFTAIAKRAGVKRCLHELRHTTATLLLHSGADLPTTSAILGHAQVSTTANIYAHAVEGAKRDAMTALGSHIGRRVAKGA